MNDKLRLAILGLVITVMVAGPFYLAHKPQGPKPVLAAAAKFKGACLGPKELMRARHGAILKQWKLLNRAGQKSGPWPLAKAGESESAIMNYSFNTCFNCHDNRRNFCLRCHDNLSLKTNCFDCHFSPEDKIKAGFGYEPKNK